MIEKRIKSLIFITILIFFISGCNLSVPTGLSATDGTCANKIVISWKKVFLADVYTIQRIDPEGRTITIADITQTTYDDTDIENNITYTYAVKAFSLNDNYTPSEWGRSDMGYASSPVLYDPQIEKKVDELLYQMSQTDKCDQLRPINVWHTKTIHVQDEEIPGFYYADGPKGVGDDGATPAANGYAAGTATSFPSGTAMASTWDMNLIEEVGQAIGKEWQASGVNVGLGACIDIVRDPRAGRTQETLGEDPYLAGKSGAAFVRGMQSTGVIACLKHYNLNYIEKGRGDAVDMILNRYNNYLIDQRTLIEHYGLPFKMAIEEGNAMAVMAGYNFINGEKCTQNYNLLTEILRGLWGYKYWVISDWTANISTLDSIYAGMDVDESIVIPSAFQISLLHHVKNGNISEDILNRAVKRVLRTKLKSGIMDYYNQFEPYNINVINSPEHQALSEKAAQKAIVLLENRNHTLPLDMNKIGSIAVIGPNADLPEALLGEGKGGSSRVEAAYQVTALEGIRNKIHTSGKAIFANYAEGCSLSGNILSNDLIKMNEAVTAAKEADVVIFVGGLNHTIEGESTSAGDRKDWTIELPGRQGELINRIKNETGKKIILILAGGGAIGISECIDNIDALLMAWYPGMEGGNALAEILLGEYNPGGKLCMTFPKDDCQMPDFGHPDDRLFDFSNDIITGVGYRYYDNHAEITPQYAFGYGLSYTTFEIKSLQIDASSMPVKVRVEITNTGEIQGDEVVQLYLQDPQCSVPMPIKQLKAFKRVTLAPKASAMVEFELTEDKLSYYDVYSKSYRVEPGTFNVMVGNSSDNLLLTGSFIY